MVAGGRRYYELLAVGDGHGDDRISDKELATSTGQAWSWSWSPSSPSSASSVARRSPVADGRRTDVQA